MIEVMEDVKAIGDLEVREHDIERKDRVSEKYVKSVNYCAAGLRQGEGKYRVKGNMRRW